ncbi:hypothetical protein ABZ636_19850 [Streptomyces sp. NPDC007251]|uniref:hypothetical protein n=1 Tax=Streptomyces sp. NPDC007251 TaxID=3154483 RepID=UPI0033C198C4
MLPSTAHGDSRLSLWLRVRAYAVPPSMIELATGRRLAGDWAGACAAARVDVDLDLRRVARAHGREIAASVRADLRRLAPDLLRWHMPRIAPDGLLRPGLTLTLARYERPGRTGPLHLVARTPPAWADAGQRIGLALWDPAEPPAGRHPHPRPNRRYRLDLHRHLWDAGRAGELRERSGADGPAPPDADPLALAPPGHGCAVGRWAAEAALLLHAEGRPGGPFAVRLGSRHRLLLRAAEDVGDAWSFAGDRGDARNPAGDWGDGRNPAGGRCDGRNPARDRGDAQDPAGHRDHAQNRAGDRGDAQYPAGDRGDGRNAARDRGDGRNPAGDRGDARNPARDRGDGRNSAGDQGHAQNPAGDRYDAQDPAEDLGHAQKPAGHRGDARNPTRDRGDGRNPAGGRGDGRKPARERRGDGPGAGSVPSAGLGRRTARSDGALRLRLVGEPPPGGFSAVPVLPDAATWVAPDLELLRAGLLGPEELHPLVAAALAPGREASGAVAGPDPVARARQVECRGATHRIGLVDGVLAPLDHDPDEIRREELLAALGGPPLPCLRAVDEAHRRPDCLAGVRELLGHGDTEGALAVVEGLLGPGAVLREGPLRDELTTAAERRIAYGLYRAGLTGPGHAPAGVGRDRARHGTRRRRDGSVRP